MFKTIYIYVLIVFKIELSELMKPETNDDKIDVIDLARSTTWKDLSEYYNALEKRWKVCVNCGIPGLGTGMHLEHSSTSGSLYPAVIPTEFLMAKLSIIDVSSITKLQPALVLTLEVALQWIVLKHDPRVPTMLLFKFGYTDTNTQRIRSCVCNTPGISYELADWIAKNLTHVVGVATDAPTLESEQTREFTARTVSNLLGKSGIYMIENVNLKTIIPEEGCMALAMPLKMEYTYYVPTRLTAFCPADKTNKNVVLALKKTASNTAPKTPHSRLYDVNLEEILKNYK